jgi:hypothetical protein
MATYYVATTGDDGAAGTIGSPFKTLNYAFNYLSAGDSLLIRGGIYTDMANSTEGISVTSKTGTVGNPFRIQNYPGETVIFNCAALSSSSAQHVGITFDSCSWWEIFGIEVINVVENTNQNAPSTGWGMMDCDHIELIRCIVRDCANGFALYGNTGTIIYQYCDSYQNHDHWDNGGFANGFSCNINSSGNITYLGCRAWLNSDDGWDSFSVNEGSGLILWYNCWSFENGSYGGVNGNGAGFKSGKSHLDPTLSIERSFINCLSFGNTGIGFDESQDINDPLDATSIPHVFYNCTSYNNAVGWNFQYGAGTNIFVADIFRNCISYLDDVVMWGNNNNDVAHNSWQDGISVSSADFLSLDSTQAKGARQSNGNLPKMTFLHLAATSDLRGAGEYVAGVTTDCDGVNYSNPPDLGCFSYGEPGSAVLITAIQVTGVGGATTIATQGGTLQMQLAITPSNATNQNITWTLTPGSGGGTVSGSGLVTAIYDGTVTIRATAQDGSGVYGTLVLTFSNQASVVLATAVTVTGAGNATTITVDNGTLQMSAHIDPHNATNQSVIWEVIPGTGTATITQAGVLTAVSDGTVTVRATAQDSI